MTHLVFYFFFDGRTVYGHISLSLGCPILFFSGRPLAPSLPPLLRTRLDPAADSFLHGCAPFCRIFFSVQSLDEFQAADSFFRFSSFSGGGRTHLSVFFFLPFFPPVPLLFFFLPVSSVQARFDLLHPPFLPSRSPQPRPRSLLTLSDVLLRPYFPCRVARLEFLWCLAFF